MANLVLKRFQCVEDTSWRAARRIVLTGKAEELAIVTFKGGGGQYNVRYAQT